MPGAKDLNVWEAPQATLTVKHAKRRVT